MLLTGPYFVRARIFAQSNKMDWRVTFVTAVPLRIWPASQIPKPFLSFRLSANSESYVGWPGTCANLQALQRK